MPKSSETKLPYTSHSPAQSVARSDKRSLDFATSSADRLRAILTDAPKTRNVVVHIALEDTWSMGAPARLERGPGSTPRFLCEKPSPTLYLSYPSLPSLGALGVALRSGRLVFALWPSKASRANPSCIATFFRRVSYALGEFLNREE